MGGTTGEVAALKAEAEKLFSVHQALVAEAAASRELEAVTAAYRRLAEAATAVEQAGRAWDVARAIPGSNLTVADQAEEAFFAADAHHRDVVREVGPLLERALAAAAADAVAVKASSTAFRAAQDAYFAALARR
ncbi:hypothetical protein ACIA8K_17440 [Catenuloplanes sp. NPDC051500]|uniref:hypothetical protein n=1 Tax=Catenuloplanes sp. NPDC051500 TaxID=3363959 RepID=UPI0037881FBE